MARNEPTTRAAADGVAAGDRSPGQVVAVAIAVLEPGDARDPVHERHLRAGVEGDHHRAAEADQRARQLRAPAGLAELHDLLPVQCDDHCEIGAVRQIGKKLKMCSLCCGGMEIQ
jgi:hypothetical protein